MIDDMGGLEEIKTVFDALPKPLCFDKGVLQSIGYKEFEAYYTKIQGDKEIDEAELKDVISECKLNLVRATIKYAKYQMKWLEKHLQDHLIPKDDQHDKLSCMRVIELNSSKDYEEVALKAATVFVEETKSAYDTMPDIAHFEKQICDRIQGKK